MSGDVICAIEAKDLQYYFGQLVTESPHSLIPLFDHVFNKFLDDVDQNRSNYGSLDMDSALIASDEEPEGASTAVFVTVDNRLVRIDIHHNCIDGNDNQDWLMVDLINFCGPERKAQKLYESFIRFIEGQSLGKIKSEVAAKIKSRYEGDLWSDQEGTSRPELDEKLLGFYLGSDYLVDLVKTSIAN